ncbi:GNAT family N-acetyltransferase [Candidatus Woesearchaeota archaeon]|nr:GNAT family N-acetyltransferase [Candidatus Woesearchaeota archaeon]
MKIQKLTNELEVDYDRLSEFYRSELDKLAEHYSPEELKGHKQKRTPEYFRGIIKDPAKSVDIVLSESGDLEAILEGVVHQDGNLKIADLLWVLANNKGKGLGTQLIQHYIEEQKDKADIVALTVSKTNTKAIRLYERLGFNYVNNLNENSLVYALPISEKGEQALKR